GIWRRQTFKLLCLGLKIASNIPYECDRRQGKLPNWLLRRAVLGQVLTRRSALRKVCLAFNKGVLMASSSARTDVTRSAVLAHIGGHGPTSRADLARELRVSPALITQHTRQLISDGLLQELAHSPSQGGRPARLLGLVADAGRAIGVKVVTDHVALVEVGIDGSVIRSAT